MATLKIKLNINKKAVYDCFTFRNINSTRKRVHLLHTLYKIVILSVLCLFHSALVARPIHLDTYSSEQGLSQNSITCSITDKQGFHWFSTQGGLNRFDGYEFKRFKSHPSEASISGNWVTDCLSADQHAIWFSTASNGLNLLDTQTGQFKVFNTQTELAITDNRIWSLASDSLNNIWLGHEHGKLTRLNIVKNEVESFSYTSPEQANTVIQDIVIDTQQNIWLATSEGLIKFNPKHKTFNHIAGSHKNLWRLQLNAQGQLLVASKQGLSLFNPKTEAFGEFAQFAGVWITDILVDDTDTLWLTSYGKGLFYKTEQSTSKNNFQHIPHNKQQLNGLANDYLLSLYQDRFGIIWIGTDGYGLQRYDKKQNQFSHQQHLSDDDNTISHNFVRALLKDTQGQLWVGTRDGLNKQTDTGFKHYKVNSKLQSGLTNNNVFSLHEDNKQRLWIGTYGGGLLQYNPTEDNFIAYTMQSHQLSSDRVYAITSDPKGNLWLGSNQGLTRFNPDTLEVKHYKHDDSVNSLANNTVFTLLFDQNANGLWVGTRAGLDYLSIEDESFTHYPANQASQTGLSHNMITSLHLQNNDTLWVGTFGGLNRLDKKTQKISYITEHDGLLNDNIFAIKDDSKGYLWLSSNQGLTRYNPTNQAMQHFLPRDGVQHNSFILGAAFQAADGELFFGGINGFNQFYPSKLQLSTSAPTPVLTELLIYNQASETKNYLTDQKQPAKLINHTKKLSFPTSQGVIGFKYAAINNASSANQYQYAYKLNGLDKQFIHTDASQRQVNYSQLSAGNYQLQLKVKDQYGQWSKVHTMLKLTVTPPWWQTQLAYAAYFIIVLIITWLILASRYRAKTAEQLIQQERKLNQLKTQFLDNISHELKTPLSLILAPVENLQQQQLGAQAQQQVSIIKRNGHRLLNLINELLQLSQRPSSATEYVSAYSLSPFVAQIVDDFAILFAQKNINFSFKDTTQQPSYINLETKHTLSIIDNLLTNALKYTPSDGTVNLTLSNTNNNVVITVSDTGIGIEEHQQALIFERFTRIATHNQTGSGIGLALVKQLVDQYDGQISLVSKINKGSCFTVTLPLCESDNLLTDKQLAFSQTMLVENNKKLLIVEDNEEMRELLVSLFSDNYTCLTANNGEEGLVLCQTQMPDIVLSDVMMPTMDGYQLLSAIRSDISINHIPVLLLSAKADNRSRIKGLDLLADDYLYKPFEASLLKSRVHGLLGIRDALNKHLIKQLSAQAHAVTLDAQIEQNKDYTFTERLKTILRENYQNELFSVEEFASAMCLSPRALQLKMKALFDITPSDYIRNTRLEYAAKLLTDSDLTIGLVADNTGFSSQSYFARCFKAKYSLTPKQYREAQTCKSN